MILPFCENLCWIFHKYGNNRQKNDFVDFDLCRFGVILENTEIKTQFESHDKKPKGQKSFYTWTVFSKWMGVSQSSLDCFSIGGWALFKIYVYYFIFSSFCMLVSIFFKNFFFLYIQFTLLKQKVYSHQVLIYLYI